MAVVLQTAGDCVLSPSLFSSSLFWGGVAGLSPHTWHRDPWPVASWPGFRVGSQGWRPPWLPAASRNSVQRSHAFLLSSMGPGKGWRGVLDFPLQFSPVRLKVLIDTSSAGGWYPTITLALAMWLPGHARLMGGGCRCPPDSAVQPCPLSQLSSHP